uniref:DHC_N1 domain-containing protein n=1 Tax=Haemonchus placei TaxID=6290 RepID=A0A0N4X9V4_HAEPC
LTEALNEAAVSQRRGFVSAAAELWPTGLIRILLPEVKAIGRCVCLAGHEDMAALVRRAAQEGTPRLMTDSWEPIPPCEIRTEQHLLSYLAAFLGHFGPQHIIIDIPLRLLLKSLSGNWPTTGQALAEWATKRSYQFIVMFEVLYLASSIRHRRILVEAVQTKQSLAQLSSKCVSDFEQEFDKQDWRNMFNSSADYVFSIEERLRQLANRNGQFRSWAEFQTLSNKLELFLRVAQQHHRVMKKAIDEYGREMLKILQTLDVMIFADTNNENVMVFAPDQILKDVAAAGGGNSSGAASSKIAIGSDISVKGSFVFLSTSLV